MTIPRKSKVSSRPSTMQGKVDRGVPSTRELWPQLVPSLDKTTTRDSEQATEKHPGPEFEEDRKDNSLFLLGELRVASKGHWSVESSELLNPTQPRCPSEIRAGLGLVAAPSSITGQRRTRITVQCCPDQGPASASASRSGTRGTEERRPVGKAARRWSIRKCAPHRDPQRPQRWSATHPPAEEPLRP